MMPGEIFRSLARSPHDSVSHHTIPYHALNCVFLSLPFSCLPSVVQLFVRSEFGHTDDG